MKSLIIRNVEILTETTRLNPGSGGDNAQDILIKDGHIARIGKDLPLSKEETQFDGTGLIATPGWIDIQLNGAFGCDFTENPASIWQAAKELPKLGTTSFLPTIITSPLETFEKAITEMKNYPPGPSSGSQALGLHLEGPFLNPGKKGAHNPKYLRHPRPELIDKWKRADGVLLVTLAPELDEDYETIRRLRQNAVVVSIGHSLANYDLAMESFKNGITCGTHLFNAQAAIEHRQPGLSIAVLNSPEIYTGIIIDGIHVHPAMVELAWKSKGSGRLVTVTDAISALGMPPGKYNLGDFEINVTETRVTLNDGTLAGSNITLQKSLLNLMKWTGCSLYDSIRTVTATPSELLHLPNKGRISQGADADLVLINPDFEIKATIVNGEILYNCP